MIYFLLSRYLVDPFAWVFLIIVASLVLYHHKRQRLALAMLGATAVAMFALMTMPLDQLLIRPLENRYPRPPLPTHVDGIVVLSGGLGDPSIVTSRDALSRNRTTDRLIAARDVATRFPNAQLVFSGVTPGAAIRQAQERAAIWKLVDLLGIKRSRVVFEDKSTNTFESLVYCRRLLHPKKGETWLLVTSAVHMSRSMAVARHLGWEMIPWPSDYLTTPNVEGMLRIEDPAEILLGIDAALHEWVGLIVYRMHGWTD